MTYSDVILLPTYDERLKALQLKAKRFEKTFGNERWLNQVIYHSYEWRKFRDLVLTRDCGCDLAIPGLEIIGRFYVHHIEPLTKEDIVYRSNKIYDLENVICVSYDTHDKIHYKISSNTNEFKERVPNDTCPWKN